MADRLKIFLRHIYPIEDDETEYPSRECGSISLPLRFVGSGADDLNAVLRRAATESPSYKNERISSFADTLRTDISRINSTNSRRALEWVPYVAEKIIREHPSARADVRQSIAAGLLYHQGQKYGVPVSKEEAGCWTGLKSAARGIKLLNLTEPPVVIGAGPQGGRPNEYDSTIKALGLTEAEERQARELAQRAKRIGLGSATLFTRACA